MALVLADRVKVRSRSTGTGAMTLENPVSGYQSFAVIGNGNDTYYGIVDARGNWEIGQGTYTHAGTTLSRNTVISSSNSGNLVNFPAGSKNVYCTFPSSVLNLEATGSGDRLVNGLNEAVLNSDGSITLPTLSTINWEDTTLTGPTLQMGNDPTVSDAVITGPAPDLTNPNAVRVIIQGQQGFGGENNSKGEGGDVYIWAGSGADAGEVDPRGDGGDVKLRGGFGGNNGGYIRLESGDAQAENGNGGFLDLNAGNSFNTGGTGGDVNIRAGGGTLASGAVYINTNNKQWVFAPDGSLTLPGGFAYPNSALQRDTGTVSCLGNASTMVYTTSSASNQHTIKLLIQVEGFVGVNDVFDTQACEMIIAKSFRANAIAASVYGVVHTSVAPLATFSAVWNALTSKVEVMCTAPTANTVEVRIFATEITTSD